MKIPLHFVFEFGVQFFSDFFRPRFERQGLSQNFFQEDFSADQYKEYGRDPYLDLLENFFNFQEIHPADEEVRNGGYAHKPEKRREDLRPREFSKLHLRPAGGEDHQEIGADEELRNDDDLFEVLGDIVGVKLGGFVLFQFFVYPPSEARASHELAEEVEEIVADQDSRKGRNEEIEKPQAAVDDEVHRD